MKVKHMHLKLVEKKNQFFDVPAFSQFITVRGIKIETVESYLKRGGTITYIGAFSDPLHPTNSLLIPPFVNDNKAA